MGWRLWTVAGTTSQNTVGAASVLRIMVGVAGGIVLAAVLLLLLAAALGG